MADEKLYAEAFSMAWEHVKDLGPFTDEEYQQAYGPLKAKVYALMEEGEMDPLKLATAAISWLRDRTQIERSAARVDKMR